MTLRSCYAQKEIIHSALKGVVGKAKWGLRTPSDILYEERFFILFQNFDFFWFEFGF